METSLILMEQIGAMALMVLMGFILRKSGKLTGEQSRHISTVSVYVLVPCSLIQAFQGEFELRKVEALGVAFLLSGGIYCIYMVMGRWMEGGPLALSPGELCSVVYSNSGNLVIPIIAGVLGSEYVIYSCAFMFIQIFLLWTHGEGKLGGEGEFRLDRILTNPAIISATVGFVLFLSHIRLPGILATAISSMGNCLGPMSMLIVGILLAEVDVKQALSNRRIYQVLLLRLVGCPLLVLPLLLAGDRLWESPLKQGVLIVMMLCAAAPPASLVTQIAQFHGHREARYISSINAVCTVCCVVTMPCAVLALQLLTA